jgi:tetratricopeptide (TPR) repeat protein
MANGTNWLSGLLQRRLCILVMTGILLVVGLVYWPVLGHDFVNFDDNLYVYENEQLLQHGLSLAGIAWSFTTLLGGNWHPLTWLSHMVDVRLFGLNPAGHHLVNLLIHGANTLLLFAFFRRATGSIGRSAVVALLFALHPLHVESVAWVAERKDLLYAFFWLVTMHLYIGYARSPRQSAYLAMTAAFICSLLAKPMAMTLPAVLIIMDYWPLRRRAGEAGTNSTVLPARPVREKLPLFFLAGGVAAITIYAQNKSNSLASVDPGALSVNAGNAIISYADYLGKTLWPARLAVLYPFDPAAVTAPRVIAASILLGAITIGVLRAGQRFPFLVFGWLWYIVTLLPVIGLLRVGDQAYADRYTYLPLVGIFVMLVWGLHAAFATIGARQSVRAAVTVVPIFLLAGVTSKQLAYWRNSLELFTHCLQAAGDSWVAHNNIGNALFLQGNVAEAAGHYRRAIELKPDMAVTYSNLGNTYRYNGFYSLALDSFDRSIRVRPMNREAYYNRGLTYVELGDMERALKDYGVLKGIDPGLAEKLLLTISARGTSAREAPH